MTTILRIGHLKYKVNKKDHNPPHVHVEGSGATVRINLITLEVMDNETEFSKSTVNKIVKFVSDNQAVFIEKWREYHEED